jgi:hypothetical protein
MDPAAVMSVEAVFVPYSPLPSPETLVNLIKKINETSSSYYVDHHLLNTNVHCQTFLFSLGKQR